MHNHRARSVNIDRITADWLLTAPPHPFPRRTLTIGILLSPDLRPVAFVHSAIPLREVGAGFEPADGRRNPRIHYRRQTPSRNKRLRDRFCSIEVPGGFTIDQSEHSTAPLGTQEENCSICEKLSSGTELRVLEPDQSHIQHDPVAAADPFDCQRHRVIFMVRLDR